MTGFVLTDSDRSLTQRLVTQHRDHTLVGLRGEIFQRVSEHDDVKGWVLVVGGGDQFECRCDVHLSDARVAARKGCATQFGDETVDCLSVTLVVVTQPLGDITSGSERTGEHTETQRCVIGIDGVELERCSGAQQHHVVDFDVGQRHLRRCGSDRHHVLTLWNLRLLATCCEHDASNTDTAETQHLTTRVAVHQLAPGVRAVAELTRASLSARPATRASTAA